MKKKKLWRSLVGIDILETHDVPVTAVPRRSVTTINNDSKAKLKLTQLEVMVDWIFGALIVSLVMPYIR